MPELVRNDVDRALASLGSSSIGYRKFRARITPPRMEAARPETSLQAAATAESVFPLLMDVVPDGQSSAPVDISYSVTDPQITDLEQVPMPERVNVPVNAAGAPGWPIIQESCVSLTIESKTASVVQPQPRAPLRCRGVSLSDMFRILGEAKPPSEVTMSQLQDIFRRL